MECLNILIEVLRNDDVSTYTPRFHLPPGLRDVGEPLHLSKLCRIKLLDKVPGDYFLVFCVLCCHILLILTHR